MDNETKALIECTHHVTHEIIEEIENMQQRNVVIYIFGFIMIFYLCYSAYKNNEKTNEINRQTNFLVGTDNLYFVTSDNDTIFIKSTAHEK